MQEREAQRVFLVGVDTGEYDAALSIRELEELAESVEQAQAEVARLRQEVRGLKSEIRTVRAEKSQLEHRHDYELEREQARLLEDVKALKQFREQFRRAIEQDARQVLDQARSMGSDRLL